MDANFNLFSRESVVAKEPVCDLKEVINENSQRRKFSEEFVLSLSFLFLYFLLCVYTPPIACSVHDALYLYKTNYKKS